MRLNRGQRGNSSNKWEFSANPLKQYLLLVPIQEVVWSLPMVVHKKLRGATVMVEPCKDTVAPVASHSHFVQYSQRKSYGADYQPGDNPDLTPQLCHHSRPLCGVSSLYLGGPTKGESNMCLQGRQPWLRWINAIINYCWNSWIYLPGLSSITTADTSLIT